MNKSILLVDDDTELCELLTEYLTGEGFDPQALHSGEQVLQLLAKDEQAFEAIEAIVLDIMMPGMSGLELLQKLRQSAGVTAPIIMLTGRGDDIDRIVGLEMGADDYMGKPCNPRELAARLRAIIRRSHVTHASIVAPAPAVQDLHGIHLDLSARAATCNNAPLHLTGAEFNVLHCFLVDAGKVLSKEQLTRQALSRDYTQYDRSIDVHVSRIRHKLASCGVVDVIRAVRGQGYQLIMPARAVGN